MLSFPDGAAYIETMIKHNEKIVLLLLEIKTMLSRLPVDPDTCIHVIRKRSKYIRAIRTLDPTLPKAISEAMKHVSGSLAPYRDARVVRDNYQQHVKTWDGEHVAALEQKIFTNPFLQSPYPAPEVIEELKLLINSMLTELQGQVSSASPLVIFHHYRLSHRKALKTLHRLTPSSNMDRVHGWRKQVKRIWYKLRFILGDDGHEAEHIVTQLDDLGSALGDIHDIDILHKLSKGCSSDNWLHRLRHRRTEQMATALALGHQALNQNPDTYLSHEHLTSIGDSA